MKTPIAVLTADIHARNTVPRCRVDDFVAAQRRKLEYIRANVPKGCLWLDAGDLFHTWRSQPETEIMLLEILYGITFISIPGNHEIPYHNINRLDSSSFSVLCAAGIIDYCSPCTVPVDAPPGFWGAMELKTGGLKIVILHGMVWPDRPPMAAMEGMSAADVLAMYPDADIILSGHNHETFVVEADNRKLVNPGSLMRAAIDQTQHRPCFFILYSDGSIQQEFIPCDADVFAAEAYEKAGAREDRMTAFVERVQNTEGFALSFEDNLRAYCKQNQVGTVVLQEIHIAMEAKQ